MKTQNQVRITNENVRITAENVQHIGECIALSAIKIMMRFAHHPRSLDKLYAGLVEDVYGNRGYNIPVILKPSSRLKASSEFARITHEPTISSFWTPTLKEL
jgi:hypothetical protein